MEKIQLSSIYGEFGTDFTKRKAYGLPGFLYTDIIGEKDSELYCKEHITMRVQHSNINRNCSKCVIGENDLKIFNDIPFNMEYNPYETKLFPLLYLFSRGSNHSMAKSWFSHLWSVNPKMLMGCDVINIGNIMDDWNQRQKYPRITTKVEVEVDGKLKHLSANLKTIHRGSIWNAK